MFDAFTWHYTQRSVLQMIATPWIVMLPIIVESLVVQILILDIIHDLIYSDWLARQNERSKGCKPLLLALQPYPVEYSF
jgi:hypothetical protein